MYPDIFLLAGASSCFLSFPKLLWSYLTISAGAKLDFDEKANYWP